MSPSFSRADNDPVNKVDPLGLRPRDADMSTPPSGPDLPDPDCMTFNDHGASKTSSSQSSGQFEADCGAVKKTLDKYLPMRRKYKVPIHTSYCGNDASDRTIGVSGTGVFCASWNALDQEWNRSGSIYHRMTSRLWDAYEHVVIHEYAHVINNSLLNTKGGYNFIQRYVEADNERGWPALDDLDPWSKPLGGDIRGEVHRGLRTLNSAGYGGVGELLADCIAQSAKHSVKGGYWLRYVPSSGSGCTQTVVNNARRFVTGGFC